MSSSVSSEHAFSQGGITISKRHSCLKGDIVEALQCIKCAIRHDLLFQVPALSLTLELEEHDEEPELDVTGGDLREPEDESDVEGVSWDELLIEDEDE
jgi:hAT family C-terminal dimerisation region